MSYPPGPIQGPERIHLGAGTLIGKRVSLTVGLDESDRQRLPNPVITFGAGCTVGADSYFVGRESIQIGESVTFAPRVYVTDHNHHYHDPDLPIGRQWLETDPVVIGAGCWLGVGSVVLPGARLGRNVVVASNSVVRGVVPDNSVVGGVPARVLRTFDRSSERWDPPFARAPVEPPDEWWEG